MADERTTITELGTAAGMVLGEDHADLSLLEAVEIPGVAAEPWRAVISAASEDWHRYHRILRASLANGAAFRDHVLRGRDPRRIDWRGGKKTMWVSDAPVDLRVDDVFLVSAKYDSVCLLNRAPHAVFVDLLERSQTKRAPNWYETVAPDEYLAFYEAFVQAIRNDTGDAPGGFAVAPGGLSPESRVHIKYATKHWGRSMPAAASEAYGALCRVVSQATAARWAGAISAASESTKLGMLAQMIRICGNVYWLLGQAGDFPVRCRVSDAVEFRSRYRLRSFDVSAPAKPGQPRVDWKATLEARDGAATAAVIEGFCEIRWSHGKFQGNPECKVQLKTPVWELPGYSPLSPPASLF